MNDDKIISEITNSLPPPLELPKIKWQSEMWLSFIPFVLGFILFFVPQLTEHTTSQQLRLAIGIPLILAPLLVPIFVWLWKAIGVVRRRIRLYPSLYSKTKLYIDDYEQLARAYLELVKKISDEKQFEIIKAGHFNNKLFIVVRKRKNPKIDKGDLLVVADRKDGLVMGNFQVTEIRSEEVYAEGISNIDALWLGYVKSMGEVNMTPNLTAFCLQQEK